MNEGRRNFLGLAAVGAVAGTAWPGWLNHFFGDAEAGEGVQGDVATAYRRARILGKPVLVLVIPAKDEDKSDRGDVFGALLNHGGDVVLADLALCEVVCAKVHDLQKQLPGVQVPGEPLMVLLETAGKKPRPVPIDPKIDYKLPSPWKAGMEAVDKAVRKRLDQVVAAVRKAIAPDTKTLRVRAKQVDATLSDKQRADLRMVLEKNGKGIDVPMADRCAAIVRLEAEQQQSKVMMDALREAAETRMKLKPPAGAKWAKATGCGVDIEGEAPNFGIACGMGHVPELSQRFLWFYTKA